MDSSLIEQFVDKKSLDALGTFLVTDKDSEVISSSLLVSQAFGASSAFKDAAADNNDSESKLLSSFYNNLVLLIQKTWVEKSDEILKEKVLNLLKDFCSKMESKKYVDSYTSFFPIVDNVVYLMFGAQTKTVEFSEYALRIDPEFGIFWWYMQSLPRYAEWSEPKCRIAILLGMYFLANY